MSKPGSVFRLRSLNLEDRKRLRVAAALDGAIPRIAWRTAQRTPAANQESETIMKRTTCLLGLCIFLFGCAHSVMQHPATGQFIDCTAMSDYNSGTPLAYGSAARITAGAAGAGMGDGIASAFREFSCVNTYRQLGFICVQGTCGVGR